MSLNQSYECVRSAVASFLLGGAFAATLILTLAGASLALSRASIVDARSPSLNELRIDKLPRPALGLAGLA